MHTPAQELATRWQVAHSARTADADLLASLLVDSRSRTLALVGAYAVALGDALPVAYSTQINPPLWELGHIGWFQEYWIARNPQCGKGPLADPLCPRGASLCPQADALYNSSLVEHRTRWHLALPDLLATQAYLAEGLDGTLEQLARSAFDGAALYFFRLALFHEDMHAEAAIYMAQALGITLPATLVNPRRHIAFEPEQQLVLAAGDWALGCGGHMSTGLGNADTEGFVFDNECCVHTVGMDAYTIDDRPVSWRRYLAFVHAGGYTDARWWTPEGWQWLQPVRTVPRYLRQGPARGGEPHWEQLSFGSWCALDLDAPACHLNFWEVQAWCQWAGRVLPTEIQWERAAMTQSGFEWGDVWEWTASTFDPYPGYVAHPYRDYSTPWFGSRPVLRGASFATHARMQHPKYRNFFMPERNDIVAGFRTCSRHD